MAPNIQHQQYVGYIVELLRKGEDTRISMEGLPDLLRSRFGVKATIDGVSKAVESVAPLIVETKRGLVLSPQISKENQSHFYTSRVKLHPAPKRSVAMHIYQHMLEELDSVFMDAGSANGAIAEEMAYGEKRNFTVLTNNVRAVQTFLANTTIRTFVTGGVYDTADEALVGKRAEFEWKEFGCKTALVGASAVSTRYVFNHGLTGEERLKKHYWQIPADRLIVPATLGKFKGQDASCFGRLFFEPPCRQGSGSSERADNDNIDFIARATYDEWRDTSFAEYDAPGFRAKSCTIVIEPEWMIDELYPEDDLKAELMDHVSQIKGDRTKTKVDVIHSEISRDEFFRDYSSLRRYFVRNR